MSKKKVKRKVVVGKKNSATKTVATGTTKTKIAATTSRRKSANRKSQKAPLLFEKRHFTMMLAGVGLVALGLIAMLGGAQPDPNTWDPDIIYSKRITVLGPILILAGLIVEIFAIFKK